MRLVRITARAYNIPPPTSESPTETSGSEKPPIQDIQSIYGRTWSPLMTRIRATSPYGSRISLPPTGRKIANDIQFPASYSGDRAGGAPTRSIVPASHIANSSRNSRDLSTSVTSSPVSIAVTSSGVFPKSAGNGSGNTSDPPNWRLIWPRIIPARPIQSCLQCATNASRNRDSTPSRKQDCAPSCGQFLFPSLSNFP